MKGSIEHLLLESHHTRSFKLSTTLPSSPENSLSKALDRQSVSGPSKMRQSPISTATEKTGTQQPLQNFKLSTQPSATYMTASPAMTITWISFVFSGILTFYIWTDACFSGIPNALTAFLPGPLPMLAIFWSHIVPVTWIANRDGERLRAMSQSIEHCTKQPSTAVLTSSPAMTLTWTSFSISAILTFYVWTDGWFTGIPESVAVYLPGPLLILAMTWLHMVLIAVIAARDGERLRAMG